MEEDEKKSNGNGNGNGVGGNNGGDTGKEGNAFSNPEYNGKGATAVKNAKDSATIPSTTTTTTAPLYDRTVIIMDINTEDQDIETVVTQLRDSVTFLLRQYHDRTNARLYMGREVEILLNVQSPGGGVADFGLAAEQITRLRTISLDDSKSSDLTVTVCVDRVAASGGYMMACQASPGHLFAAPFAVLGSIGVLRNSMNYHGVLEKYGVKSMLLTAGEAKAPLTSTSEVTEEKVAIVQRGLDRVHVAFRKMVEDARSGTDGNGSKLARDVMEGDTFLGRDALGYGLVDRIVTSDEYVLERIMAGDRVLKLVKCEEKGGRMPSLLELLFLSKKLTEGKFMGRVMTQVAPVLVRVGGICGLLRLMDGGGSVGNYRRLNEVLWRRDGNCDVSYRGGM